ncbi:MAG: HAD-IA family hydrolase, partial [Pyramidobacter sp.]|nr:HAD-IA family hydrolase [Pyramidobacter sp.]
PLKPDVKAYLTALKSRGAKLCTASATGEPLVKLCLDRLGIGSLFDFMISCVDVGASKDRPDVYFEAARRMGAKPEETAVFEDSLKALTTAKRAGFYAVAVWDEASAGDWPALCELADEAVRSWAEATAALR